MQSTLLRRQSALVRRQKELKRWKNDPNPFPKDGKAYTLHEETRERKIRIAKSDIENLERKLS